MKKLFFKLYGWVFIRPIRWFFGQMVRNTSLRLLPEKDDCWGCWRMPNMHWWALYKTVFKFYKWLYWDAWRVFCDWTGGYRRTYPLIARIIYKIGATTSGYSISGGQCYHCGSEHGNPTELSDDDTGKYFKLLATWTVGTLDGTDHRFRGITTCPICGYKQEYEDGSL